MKEVVPGIQEVPPVVDEEIRTELQNEALKHKTATDFIEKIQSLPIEKQPDKLLVMTPEAQKVVLTQIWEQVTEEDVAGILKPIPEPKVTKKIPVKKEVTAQEIEKKFKTKPGFTTLFTAQNRTAEIIGVKDFVTPLEKGKMAMDLEITTTINETKKVIKALEKLKTVTTKEMALALNTGEEAPKDFDEKEKVVFDYFRAMTRDILIRTNKVREETGRKPIKGIQAYFRHIVDPLATDILAGRAPLPEGLKAWAAKNITSDVYNPMEKQRKLKDKLLEYFSSDLEYVTTAMLKTALKEIHLDSPKKFITEMKAKFRKPSKKILKTMSTEEQAIVAAMEELPVETEKWLDDYVKIVLLNESQTTIDERVNSWITTGKVAKLIDDRLSKFGKKLGERAITDMLVTLSKIPLYGVLGGIRPKLLLRNKMQRLQDIALYGVQAVWKGAMPTSDFPTLEKLKTDSLFLRTYSGIEEMPVDLKSKIGKGLMAAFQWSAFSNVDQSMNAAYHWAADNIQDPKKAKLEWADPQRTYKEDSDFFYPSELELLIKEMEFGAQTTQYQYLGQAMPEIFRVKGFAPFTRLQSWWMNHLFMFHREAARRALTGEVGYTITRTLKGEGPNGTDLVVEVRPKISAQQRLNYLWYLMLGGFILNTLGYGRSFVFGTMPTEMPPTAALMFYTYIYFLTDDSTPFGANKKREAARKIKHAALTFIPGYLSIKDITALLSGTKPVSAYWFYNKIGKSGKVNI